MGVGQTLALNRSRFEFADADVGPSEISFLILTEVDDRDRIVAYVRFDLEDEDAAWAELDRRFDASEGGVPGWRRSEPCMTRSLAAIGTRSPRRWRPTSPPTITDRCDLERS